MMSLPSTVPVIAYAFREVVFPTAGWENNFAALPSIEERHIQDFYSSRSTTERSYEYERSYVSVESYVTPSSVLTNSSKQR